MFEHIRSLDEELWASFIDVDEESGLGPFVLWRHPGQSIVPECWRGNVGNELEQWQALGCEGFRNCKRFVVFGPVLQRSFDGFVQAHFSVPGHGHQFCICHFEGLHLILHIIQLRLGTLETTDDLINNQMKMGTLKLCKIFAHQKPLTICLCNLVMQVRVPDSGRNLGEIGINKDAYCKLK